MGVFLCLENDLSKPQIVVELSGVRFPFIVVKQESGQGIGQAEDRIALLPKYLLAIRSGRMPEEAIDSCTGHRRANFVSGKAREGGGLAEPALTERNAAGGGRRRRGRPLRIVGGYIGLAHGAAVRLCEPVLP